VVGTYVRPLVDHLKEEENHMRIVAIADAGRLSRCILDLTTTAFPPTPHYAQKHIL
jgi:hypothetical protein